MKNHILVLFILLGQMSFAQYNQLSFAEFMKLDTLDKVISLDQNFDFEMVQTAIIQYTNKHRISKNKSILTYNVELEKWALLHSLQMQKYDFFDHINRKEKQIRDIENRADFVGYTNYAELAENLYYGFVPLDNLPTYRQLAVTIVQALIDSKSHNLNLLKKDLKEIGTAIVFKTKSEDGFLYYYVTQSFGTKY